MLLTTTAKVNAVKKLFRAKKYDEALEIAEKINPEKVASAYDLSTIAEVYMKKGRFQDAKDLYMEMYGRNKTHKVMTGLIEICLKLKEPKEAEQYLREFRRMEPDNPERLVYRYRVDCMLGKEPEFLIKSLSKLKNEEYTDVWALELAKAYYKNNDREACAKECRQILKYFPDSEVAAKARVLFDACVTEEMPAASPETPSENVDTTAMAESLMEDVSALLEENARAEAVANESLDEKSIAQAVPAHSEPYLRTPEFLSLHQPAGEDRSLFGDFDTSDKSAEKEAETVDRVSDAAEHAAEEIAEATEAFAGEAGVASAAVGEAPFEEIAEEAEIPEEALPSAETVADEAAAAVAGTGDTFAALRESYVLPEELEGKIDRVFFDDDDDDFDDEFDEDGYAGEADAVETEESAEVGEADAVEIVESAEDTEEAGSAEADDDDDDDDELVVVGVYDDDEDRDVAAVDDTDEAVGDAVNEDASAEEAPEESEDDRDDSEEIVETEEEAAAEDAPVESDDDSDDSKLPDAAENEDLSDLKALDGAEDEDLENPETLDDDDDEFDEDPEDDEFDDEDLDDEFDDEELDDEEFLDDDDYDDDDACDEENFPEDESAELKAEDVVFAASDKADEELEAVTERLGSEVCSATAEGNGSDADDDSDEKKMADTQVVPCVKEKPEIPDEDMEKMLFNLLKDIGGKETK